MGKKEKKLKIEDLDTTGIVHVILFHSYSVFFLAVVFGVIFDSFFHFDIFSGKIYQYVGFIMIIFGSLVVYWAQSTTSSKKENPDKERDIYFFFRGPYKYTRNPTNFALTIMSLGLGILINSLFSVIFIIVTYIISKLFFIKKQDLVLEKRYGKVFEDYKKRVKNWL